MIFLEEIRIQVLYNYIHRARKENVKTSFEE